MKKIMNLIKYDKKYMLILNIIAIAGIITGSIFITILNKQDKTLIVDSLNKYFLNIKTSDVSFLTNIKNIGLNNLFFSLFIWIIGISVIGVVLTILFVFYKAFIIGFSISSLIYTYSYKGILLSIIYVFPHMIINILILLFLASYSIKLSSILVKSILKKESVNFKYFINNYLKIFMISLLFTLITTLYESVILPFILKFVIKIIL